MRRHTDLSGYNRALAMHRPDPDRSVPESNALQALAANELQMIYLFVRWAGCTDVGYALHGLGKTGDAFKKPSYREVMWASKQLMGKSADPEWQKREATQAPGPAKEEP